jgi:L-lactate dehydrogenase complex protein LldF
MGPTHEPWLPFASSLCGACGEVCPVKIEIPKLLLDLRAEAHAAEAQDGGGAIERLAFRAWAWVMRHPRIYEMAGLMASTVLSGDRWFARAPGLLNYGPLRAWLSQRDLPPVGKSFRQLWRERRTAVSE